MTKTRSKTGAARIIKSPTTLSTVPDQTKAAAAQRQTKPEATVQVRRGRKETSKNVEPAKVIRDSFTMPVADYELIGVLKKRCIGLGVAIRKSELLRAGLAVLDRLADASLAQVVAAVESVKTGRPPGKKKKKKKKKKTNRVAGTKQ
jgi:hypothetical protein